MLAKIALIVLIFFIVIAWIGGWSVKLWPTGRKRKPLKRCPGCGAPLAGRTPCPCGRKA